MSSVARHLGEVSHNFAIERRPQDGQWQIVREVWFFDSRGEKDWRMEFYSGPFATLPAAELRLAEIRTALRG